MSAIQRKFEPVSFTDVSFEDAFWKPRLEANRTITIPHIYRMCAETGRISAFDLKFERRLPAPIVLIFQGPDIAKWIQAAAYSLSAHPDPDLETRLDGLIDKIVSAQQPDGYLNTHFIAAQPEMRFRNLRDWHELYCAGHLVEAAVAYFKVTGKRKFLDAMCRYMDLIATVFGTGEGQKRGYCGHPEIELALISLYRATRLPRYLELASYFVDERGRQPNYFDAEARARGEDPADYKYKTYEYCQAHLPLRAQDKVVGHAVRATYLLGAAADLAYEKDDPALWKTCLRLWDNLVTKRMYLTGGIGPAAHNEGFTEDYDLPDETAYAETCATIGLIEWNHRMLQIAGESKYADEVERGLYNGLLGSVALEGGQFFYENPLASTGQHHRQAWFDCPCCPPNIARTLASLGKYFYSSSGHDIWVHLYAQGSAVLHLAEGDVTLRQVTTYPWDGDVSVAVEVPTSREFNMHLRVPGWCSQWGLRVNGAPVNAAPGKNGYIIVTREWHTGDRVEFRIEMPIQTVWPHPAVRYLQGRMALQRGPLVYCLEGVDNNSILLDRISVHPGLVQSGAFRPVHQESLLGGVTVLRGNGRLITDSGWEGRLYRNQAPVTEEMDITAIPYYAWDNRSPGEMRIWLRAEI